MGEVLKKFGRYFLLDHIAQGGMAEIYRARLASKDGAGRIIVIKRIQAGFGANSEFLQMFKSEIKVTMGFNHPNIVQLYDFGEEANQPYISMEMVDGRNLKQFINRALERKQSLPIDLAVYIIEQAASGLHYAHSFKDKITGEPLNIVHRDISPQNILVSYEGNVKVIDFGIAKATTNMEATRAGVIKGKPSYLSPEQISGEVLDGRSDVFALGAVLWESLTGRKLFSGDSDLAVLKQIESAQSHVKPPSTINPKVSKELDYITLKSLTKSRDKRYSSADEFQRALHKHLYSNFPDFNPSDLAFYAKELFKNEILEDRKRIQKLNDKVEHILSIEPQEMPGSARDSEDATVAEPTRRGGGPDARVELTEVHEASVEIERPRGTHAPPAKRAPAPIPIKGPSSRSQPSSIRATAPAQRRMSTANESEGGNLKYIAIGIVGLIGLAVVGPEFGVKVPVLSNMISDWMRGGEARLVLQSTPQDAEISINGKIVANALPATLQGIPVGTPFRLSVTGPNGTFQEDVTLKKGEEKILDVLFGSASVQTASSGQRAPAAKNSIILKLKISPGGGNARITLNGSNIDPSYPNVRVPLDSPMELIIQRQRFKPFRREFVLQSSQIGGLGEWVMDVQLEPVHFGYLSIRTTPSAKATIMFDGTPWVEETPIEREKIPVGTYSIRLSNDVLGMEKNVTVTIQEGKSINLDERLEIKN